MLEIGILVYVCMEMSRIAERKQLSKRSWVIRTIISWIMSELMILTIVIGVFRIENLIYLLCFGLLGGFLGYLFTKRQLLNYPDVDVID